MIEQIDVIFPLIILVGGLYGFIKGPFSLVLPFVASFFMFPILMYLKPYLFVFLENSENIKVYHLVYYPIVGFFLFALIGMLARKLDSKVKKYIPGGKGLWGFIIGVFISSFVCIALMVFTLPLLMQFAPKVVSKSWTLSSMAVWFEEHPKRYEQLNSFLHIDTIKGALEKVKTLRDGGQAPIQNQNESTDPQQQNSDLKTKAELQNQENIKKLQNSLYGNSDQQKLNDSTYDQSNVNDLAKEVFGNSSIKSLQDSIYKNEKNTGQSMSSEKLSQLKEQLKVLLEIQKQNSSKE
ncbi:MAG: CvpA family protein [Candidatus Cloacimonetes bacterium]|nr:CvpA family protein [Candidatus Cloacimonadota bacterium]